MDLTIALVGVAAILVLTGISAFFSSSELAVFSVPSHRVDSLLAADVPGARRYRRCAQTRIASSLPPW